MSQQAKILYLINYVGILACVLVSGPLWGFGSRDIPEIPFFVSLEIGLGTWALFFTCLGLCSLGLTLIYREKYSFLVGLFAFAMLLLSDVTRLQPWLYIHLFIMGYLVFTEVVCAKRAIILILGLTYVWSGLQKFNVFFAVEIYPWLWQAFDENTLKLSTDELIKAQTEGVIPPELWGAKLAALFELLGGLVLILFSRKWWAYLAPISIHLFLLLVLGPLGHKFNLVVWPWNLMLIALLIYMAIHPTEWDKPSALQKKFYPIYLLVGIAPLLFPFAYWDSHLSGSLYSGQNSFAIFSFDAKEGCSCITDSESAMSKDVSVFNESSQRGEVYLDNWVIKDVEAPFYPEERYFKAFAKKLCDCQENNENSRLEIFSKRRWGIELDLENDVTQRVGKTNKLPYLRKQVFSCADLK
jgi:hypothetical protein